MIIIDIQIRFSHRGLKNAAGVKAALARERGGVVV